MHITERGRKENWGEGELCQPGKVSTNPSKGSGPKFPLFINWNGPTFLLWLFSTYGLPQEGVTLSKMALCISGRSWRSWCWRLAVDCMPIAGYMSLLKRRCHCIFVFVAETFKQYHLKFEKFENCKSWPSGPGWTDTKHYYHNNQCIWKGKDTMGP